MNIIETNNSKKATAYVGSGLIRRAGEFASERFALCVAVIITDDITGSYYISDLEESLYKSGFTVERIIFPSGEWSKSFATLDMILNRLAELGVGKRDMIFALGGDTVCGLAGFAASVYMCGIKLVNVPTTLFAAVSSSVGGRNSLNIRAGKNLAGIVYNPDMIITDYSAFDTIDSQDIFDGYAEIVRLSVVKGGKLLNILSNDDIPERLEEIISECITLKSRCSSCCESSSNMKPLNLGDTLMHAIRKCSNYSISRGQATAAALMITAEGAFRSGICGNECRDVIFKVLSKLEVDYSCEYSAGRLWYAALSDYPADAKEKLPMIIPIAPGNCELKYISTDDLFKVISLGRNALG